MKPIRMSHCTSSLCEALQLIAIAAANPNPKAFAVAFSPNENPTNPTKTNVISTEAVHRSS
jgi:hypothetical protein